MRRYLGSIAIIRGSILPFTDIEWLPCEGFLALLAVLLPLIYTVYVCAIASCELDMSTSQQGYNWTQSFVFLETRNGEKVELVRLVADLSLLPHNAVPNLRELCL